MEIDIVIPWVDGADPEWKKNFYKYKPSTKNSDVRNERYRDWGLFQYWFRGIEKFAPWVRKIHFITCGHIPSWLDIKHPKLNIVFHEDYIPVEYLPVFSSHPIEIFMDRIKGLSEQFIYFNDDFFVISPISKDMFFTRGKICDAAILNALSPGGISHIKLNDVEIINKHFSKKAVMSQFAFKWLNYKYGITGIRSICLLPWKRFTGFVDHHGPAPYLIKTFKKIWSLEEAKLLETASSRFRSISDINQYLFRYWQLCEGDFHPINIKSFHKYFEISNSNIKHIAGNIVNQKTNIITINDGYEVDFDAAQADLKIAFDKILPIKSSFEL